MSPQALCLLWRGLEHEIVQKAIMVASDCTQQGRGLDAVKTAGSASSMILWPRSNWIAHSMRSTGTQNTAFRNNVSTNKTISFFRARGTWPVSSTRPEQDEGSKYRRTAGASSRTRGIEGMIATLVFL